MTKLREIYKCEICGNVVEVLQEGAGTLVCCGQDMVKLEAKTKDDGLEKHVPVVEETNTGVKVKVGDVSHPMEEDHYIKLIEVLTDDQVIRAELEPGEKPEAEFKVNKEDILTVREFCTVHDLWETE